MPGTWDLYSGKSDAIDLRQELDTLLYGDDCIVSKGQWIILRAFDTTKFSEYYKEETREGVGGPKYVFTDKLVKTYKWHNFIQDPFVEKDIKVGSLHQPLVTFFFEYDVDVKHYYEIYEFDMDEHSVKPNISDIKKPYSAKYNLKLVQTYRLDNGRKEFILVRALEDGA